MKHLIILATAAAIAATSFAKDTAPAEKSEDGAGFVRLFDGRTFDNWRSRANPAPPAKGWIIENGILTVLPKNAGGGGGDIITVKKYSDFILKLEFRLTPKANSGIKYLFNPDRFGGTTLEYQILAPGHPDAERGRNGNRKVASLYDMFPANAENFLKPAGKWNEVKLLVRGMHVEHWLNGRKVLEFNRDSDNFTAAFSKSKYKKHKGWGSQTEGHILLQDHNDRVSYRNIRIKELK
ncbi:MAG: DUF1080 domain-containing protein [Kiritimatiellia bacterium]